MSTRSREPSSGTAGRLVQSFARFGPAYRRWIEVGMRDTGLSFARMRLLHELHLAGPLTMGALRARLDVTARNITQLVDALEADGLARRTPHPTDRRATVIELTTAGQDAVRNAFAAHALRAEALFGRLAPDDQAELVRLIDLLSDAMADLGVESDAMADLGVEGDGLEGGGVGGTCDPPAR